MSRRLIVVVVFSIALAAGLWWWSRPMPSEAAVAAEVAPVADRPAAQPERVDPLATTQRPAAPARPAGGTTPASAQAVTDLPPAPNKIDDHLRRQFEQDMALWYEDVGTALGLTEDEKFALVRTLTEHGIQGMELPFSGDRMAAMERGRELWRAHREDLLGLLGAQRLAKLDAYEKSIGARRVVQDVARALAHTSTPISEAKRRELVHAAIDAGAYFDDPRYTGVESVGALTQEMLAKMEIRDAKLVDAARRVLGADYAETIEGIQRASREGMEGVLRNLERPPN